MLERMIKEDDLESGDGEGDGLTVHLNCVARPVINSNSTEERFQVRPMNTSDVLQMSKQSAPRSYQLLDRCSVISSISGLVALVAGFMLLVNKAFIAGRWMLGGGLCSAMIGLFCEHQRWRLHQPAVAVECPAHEQRIDEPQFLQGLFPTAENSDYSVVTATEDTAGQPRAGAAQQG